MPSPTSWTFNDFLELAEAALEELDLEGILQIAPFHPRFVFAGTRDDDITNYTNRTPYPTLHLIRETSIDRAVQAFPEAEAIFEVNMATMEKLGPEGWAALDVGATSERGRLWQAQAMTKKKPAAGPAVPALAPEIRLRPVSRAAQGAAHPHARGQAQPGLAAQAQAGLPPVPVHRKDPAGAAGNRRRTRAASRWPTMARASPTSALSFTTCTSRR
jgi:hypothetical protein